LAQAESLLFRRFAFDLDEWLDRTFIAHARGRGQDFDGDCVL
jgi:hypothetical protein